jgi:catechol 2,3-dioxygenase-like lactoylglutathione lyase family enzyme
VSESGVGFAGFTEALSHVAPCLRVGDAARSLEFYVDQLGFRERWRHHAEPDLPTTIGIGRGGATLILTDLPDVPFGAVVYLYTSELDTVFHELAARGITIELAPTEMPWRLREMHLRDPDGNRLRFAQSVLT